MIRRANSSLRRTLVATTAVASFLFVISPSLADDVLRPGDVVRMSVVGVPQLDRDAPVETDGKVSLPIFGDVDASGRALSELRRDLRERAPGQSYRSSSENGTSVNVEIRPENVFVDFASRRPVYVSGDVASPGDRPYVPGMTVRQVVALVGGLDLMRIRKTDPFLDGEDMRTDLVNGFMDVAAKEAKVKRLEAELAGRPTFENGPQETAVTPEAWKPIFDAQKRELAIAMQAHERDATQIDKAIEQTGIQIASLDQQKDVQAEEVEAGRKDLKEMESMLVRGLVQTPRVTDARRSVQIAASLGLQASVEGARAQQEHDELVRKRAALDSDREARLVAELAQSRIDLESARSKIQGTERKLVYTNVLRSQLVDGRDLQPVVKLHRTTGDGSIQVIDADMDTHVEPGDVVDVALRLEAGAATDR